MGKGGKQGGLVIQKGLCLSTESCCSIIPTVSVDQHATYLMSSKVASNSKYSINAFKQGWERREEGREGESGPQGRDEKGKHSKLAKAIAGCRRLPGAAGRDQGKRKLC